MGINEEDKKQSNKKRMPEKTQEDKIKEFYVYGISSADITAFVRPNLRKKHCTKREFASGMI